MHGTRIYGGCRCSARLVGSRQAPAISYRAALVVVAAVLLAMAWAVLAVLVTTAAVTAALVVVAEAALLVVVAAAAAIMVTPMLGLIHRASIDSWRKYSHFVASADDDGTCSSVMLLGGVVEDRSSFVACGL